VKKAGISLGLALFFFLLVVRAGLAATPITNCTTITEGGYYILVNDIIDADVDGCINISSNDVVLDCQGHRIDGVDRIVPFGIYVSGKNNITIKNCIVSDWGYAVYLKNANTNKITNVVLYSNNFGISLDNSSNNQIDYLTSHDNNYYSVYIYQGSDNTIANSTVYKDYSETTLYLTSTSNVHIFNVTSDCANLCSYGLLMDDVDNTIIENSIIKNAASWGIYLYGSNNTIHSNRIENNGEYGIYLYNSQNNQIYNNLFNNTNNFYFDTVHTNYWNTTKQTGTNIVGGPHIGGNYWGKPDGSGYSDTCTDSDLDGICDSPYTLATDNIDYLPLAKFVPQQNPSWCDNLNPMLDFTHPDEIIYLVFYSNENISTVFGELIVDGTSNQINISNFTPYYRGEQIWIPIYNTSLVNYYDNSTHTFNYTLNFYNNQSAVCLYSGSFQDNPLYKTPLISSYWLNQTHVGFSIENEGENYMWEVYILDGNWMEIQYISDWTTESEVVTNHTDLSGMVGYYHITALLPTGYDSIGIVYRDETGDIPYDFMCANITSPGIYYLTYDVYNDVSGKVCFRILSDDVIFNCLGHTIEGRSDNTGIKSEGYNNITITNCTIKNTIIDISNAHGVRVYGNVFYSDSAGGTITHYLSNAIDIKFYNNTLKAVTSGSARAEVYFSIDDTNNTEIYNNLFITYNTTAITNATYTGNSPIVDIIFHYHGRNLSIHDNIGITDYPNLTTAVISFSGNSEWFENVEYYNNYLPTTATLTNQIVNCHNCTYYNNTLGNVWIFSGSSSTDTVYFYNNTVTNYKIIDYPAGSCIKNLYAYNNTVESVIYDNFVFGIFPICFENVYMPQTDILEPYLEVTINTSSVDFGSVSVGTLNNKDVTITISSNRTDYKIELDVTDLVGPSVIPKSNLNATIGEVDLSFPSDITPFKEEITAALTFPLGLYVPDVVAGTYTGNLTITILTGMSDNYTQI